MKSKTLSSFWKVYEKLSKDVKEKAKKSYEIWRRNPFHPSLHFKCINQEENVWSLRVSRGYRALCIFEKDFVVWFWIGSHDEYEQFIQKNRIN